MRQRNKTRRSVLSIIGATAAGSTLIPLSVGATKRDGTDKLSEGHDFSEFYDEVAARYGKREARITVSIVKKNIKLKQSQGWSPRYTNEQIMDDILSHPKTPEGSEALRRYKNSVQSQGTLSQENIESISPDSLVTKAQTALNPRYKRTKRYASYNCRAESDVDLNRDKLYAVANASLFGNGYAWSRLYARYRPDQTRSYDVSCRYFRKAWVRNANAKVRLYVKEDGKGIRKKTVETIASGADSRTFRTVSFNLTQGRGYDIGIELYTQAAAGGDPAAWADVYNSTASGRRHVRVIDLLID